MVTDLDIRCSAHRMPMLRSYTNSHIVSSAWDGHTSGNWTRIASRTILCEDELMTRPKPLSLMHDDTNSLIYELLDGEAGAASLPGSPTDAYTQRFSISGTLKILNQIHSKCTSRRKGSNQSRPWCVPEVAILGYTLLSAQSTARGVE